MAQFLHASSSVTAVAVGTLLSAIWEGGVLAVCVFLCLRMLPGISAAARSVVWMTLFLVLVVLHFLPLMMRHVAHGGPAGAAPFQLDPVWSLAIAAVWAGLSLLRAVQLVNGAIRLKELAAHAVPVPGGEELNPLLQVQIAGVKWRRSAQLCLSDEVQRPSVLGFFR